MKKIVGFYGLIVYNGYRVLRKGVGGCDGIIKELYRGIDWREGIYLKRI